MAPVPLEGHQTPVMNSMPQEGARGSSISLGMLIEFIVQRTYHELTVLAELLPRKTDMERKIEIYNFSARTRQLFVRLLALVKWANSASKVDRSANIMAFLDKQSLLFVETADMLARTSRETLVHARLPNFHIPAAVEVLTTGTYSRLPVCIRDRIVPADPITPAERRSTLARLNQVIQHRLVTGNLLPQMRNLKIDSGRVTFHVKHEFEVSMTVMGDGPSIPWRLLDIRILVEDKDTGEGKALVHPLQVQYVHQVLQARLADNPNPLTEVYSCLHFFAQSLQLEVLYSQTLRLMRDRLDGHIHIDEYTAGRCLAISYWRELTSRDPRSELGYRLTVQVDTHDPYRPLTVVHVPTLGVKESEIADRAIRSETLSLERLLVHTIYVRTHSRLSDLKTELQALLKDVECSLSGIPAVLSVPILSPCQRAEQLLVTVDTHTGALQCSVPQCDVPFMAELQAAFNGDRSRLVPLINELRYWLTMRRCEKTLQPLPATPHERLPLLFSPDHPLAKLSSHRMFVKLHRHPNVILIVELKQKESSPCEIDCTFHLTVVKPSSLEDEPSKNSSEEVAEQEIPKMYLKVITFLEFDGFVMTHGPFTNVDDPKLSGKRRNGGLVKDGRRSKTPAYFIPELAHVVALCDERVPFVTLAQELNKREIAHQGLQVEANATALVLRLVQLPPPPRCCQNSAGWLALLKRLLSVSIRVCTRSLTRSWVVEYVFFGSPLTSSHPREQGMRRPLIFQYNLLSADQVGRTVDAMLNDWGQVVHLYGLVEELAEQLKNDKRGLASMVTVKSYSYNRLLLAYGPDKGATVTVQWNSQTKSFSLVFGATGKCVAAHSIMREQLEAHLNRHCNLAQIVYLLHETYEPLVSICRLPTIPQLGVTSSRPQIPVLTFTMIPQSPSLIRISYQNTYCLELRIRGGGFVTLRDGAYSRFDRVKVVDEFMPTQQLKSFLSKYSDETVVRRRSQSEDDNPPSPVTMQMEGGSFLGMHHRGPQSPAQREGLRFHPPLTPPNTHSNPHTPASPHTTSISQTSQPHQNYGSSPATSFSLASPPSLPPNLNPSPSPGVGLMVNSPSNPLQMPSPLQMPIASPGPCSSGMTVGHSPAGSFMGQTGHMDGSPFPSSQSMTSPAASNWPGSPGMPRPSPARPGQSPGAPGHPALHSPDHKGDLAHQSRVLPSKIWAGAVPTTLTYEALDRLCRPSPGPNILPGVGGCQLQSELSPLERFLGCIYMRRQMQRHIQNEESLSGVPSNESGVIHFKVESLQCRVILNPQHFQSLHIEVTSLPDHKDQWSLDEIQTMEKFFDTRVAVPPYKPNALLGFARMLNVPYCVLKDFVQIMKLDLVPTLAQQQQLKWGVQICLRVPPSAAYFIPTGQAGVLVHRNRILFFLQLWRLGMPFAGVMPAEVVLPLVYDLNTKTTTVAERRDPGPSIAITTANIQLKRFAAEYVPNAECTLFQAVRDLLANLTLPSESSQVTPSSAGQGGVPIGVPIPPQMQSPAGMMHSPMGGGGPGPAGLGGPQQAQPGSGYPMGMPVGQHPMMGPQ